MGGPGSGRRKGSGRSIQEFRGPKTKKVSVVKKSSTRKPRQLTDLTRRGGGRGNW